MIIGITGADETTLELIKPEKYYFATACHIQTQLMLSIMGCFEGGKMHDSLFAAWWHIRLADEPEYWIKKLAFNLRHQFKKNETIVIADVTLPQEVEWIVNKGGQVLDASKAQPDYIAWQINNNQVSQYHTWLKSIGF